MKGFSDSEVMGRKAGEEEVGRYREFLGRMGEEGIWEGETKFLEKEREGDLVVPDQREEAKGEHTAGDLEAELGSEVMRKVAPALGLLLLGFAIIPTVWGRLAVLAIMVLGVMMVTNTPVVANFPTEDSRVIAAGAVALLAVVAGMVV